MEASKEQQHQQKQAVTGMQIGGGLEVYTMWGVTCDWRPAKSSTSDSKQ